MLETYLSGALVNLLALLKNYLYQVEYVQSGKQTEINKERAKETVLQVIKYGSTEFLCKQKLVADFALSQVPWW